MTKINLPPAIAGVSTDRLLQSSRSAWLGLRLIQAATLLRASSTIIALVVVYLLTAIPALAQLPTSGSLLGNDASRPVSLVKRGIEIFSWLVFLGGFIGVGKAIRMGMRREQGWEAPGGFGIAAFAFGYLVSWLNSEVGGNKETLSVP
jgi:hypothetical protein